MKSLLRIANALRALLRGRSVVIGAPYAWLLLFFLLPFLIVMRISVSEMENVTFKELLTLKEGVLQLTAKLSNYVFITQDRSCKSSKKLTMQKCRPFYKGGINAIIISVL